YHLAAADESNVMGRALTVHLPAGVFVNDLVTIRVVYSTTPESTAIQWLPPAQTAGKKHPYLFTQFQAIHERALFPCQDTPAVKARARARCCHRTGPLPSPIPLV